AEPTMTWMKSYSLFPQTMQPRAQQRRRFHFLGENPLGAADKGFNTQTGGPLTQSAGIERLNNRGQYELCGSIARKKFLQRFSVSNVHSTHTGQQEFTPY